MMMIKSVAALTFALSFATIPAHGGEVTFTIDDLIKLKNDAENTVAEPPDFMKAYERHLKDQAEFAASNPGRNLQDEEGTCGYFHDNCDPDLTCMRFGLEHKCMPVNCLVELGQRYRNTTFTDLFYEEIFQKAGVTPEDVSYAINEKPDYKDDPQMLFGFDNAFKRFATTFHANHPDFQTILDETNECMAKAPSKQGVTPMIGFTYGLGAVVRLDWAFFWGNGSADLNIEDGTSFIPSTFFEISFSGFAGVHIHISASFGWTFTGTKEDIPGDSLMWGLYIAPLGPNFAVKQTCDFPGSVPGVILDAGGGVGGGFSLGWTRAWMIFNGTEAVPTQMPSTRPSAAPTVTA